MAVLSWKLVNCTQPRSQGREAPWINIFNIIIITIIIDRNTVHKYGKILNKMTY